jgi:hypothetical protein
LTLHYLECYRFLSSISADALFDFLDDTKAFLDARAAVFFEPSFVLVQRPQALCDQQAAAIVQRPHLEFFRLFPIA